MKPQTFNKITEIRDAYTSGEFSSISEERHEINPELPRSSRENYLYFFLSTSINFRRSSEQLWKSALKTYEDNHTRYLFLPEEILRTNYNQFQTDMTKHNLAIQTNKHPNIWFRLCTTLYEHYDSNPKNIFQEGKYRVEKTINILQKEKRDLFPYLRGIKLSNYMIMILSHYTDLELRDIYNLSIVPDTHVIKATIKLGLAESDAKAVDVEKIWKPILKELELDPRKMHAALWHWSRNDFRIK